MTAQLLAQQSHGLSGSKGAALARGAWGAGGPPQQTGWQGATLRETAGQAAPYAPNSRTTSSIPSRTVTRAGGSTITLLTPRERSKRSSASSRG